MSGEAVDVGKALDEEEQRLSEARSTYCRSQVMSSAGEEESKEPQKPRDIREHVYSQIENTGITSRDHMRRKLVNIFKSWMVSTKAQCEDDLRWGAECALRLEDTLNALFKDSKRYSDKARFLIFNLSDPKNAELKERIFNQDFTAQEVLTLDPKNFANHVIRKQREEALQTSLEMRRNDWDIEQTLAKGEFTSFFTCEDCGSLKTGFIQLQIECADEPMTNFIYCYDCHHRWKC